MLASFLMGLVGGQRGMTPLATVSVAAARGDLPEDNGAPRLLAHPLVALAAPDDRAQPVGGDHLVGFEPRARPRRLARRRRAHEHDEARIRQPHS